MLVFDRWCLGWLFLGVFGQTNRNKVTAFLPVFSTKMHPPHGLWMGLYDTPLPPRPAPWNPNNNENDDDDIIQVTTSLFQFNVQGQEIKDRLPPLRRRLNTGIACYFEANDRLVQNLVNKTFCSVEDACWALEACQGDLTEAWTRVSVARRNQLEPSVRGTDSSSSLEQEFQTKKQARLQKEQTRERLERMKLRNSKPDTDWLPIQNPKPIDDEPWFTG